MKSKKNCFDQFFANNNNSHSLHDSAKVDPAFTSKLEIDSQQEQDLQENFDINFTNASSDASPPKSAKKPSDQPDSEPSESEKRPKGRFQKKRSFAWNQLKNLPKE